MNNHSGRTRTISRAVEQGDKKISKNMPRREMLWKTAFAGGFALLGLGVGGCNDKGPAFNFGPDKKSAIGVGLENYVITLKGNSVNLGECIRRVGQNKPAIVVFTTHNHPANDAKCNTCLTVADKRYRKYNDVPVLGIQVIGLSEQDHSNSSGKIARELKLTYPIATMDAQTYGKLQSALGLENVHALVVDWKQRAVFHAGGNGDGTGVKMNSLTAVLRMIHGDQPPRKYVNLPVNAAAPAAKAAEQMDGGAGGNRAPEEAMEAEPVQEASPEPAVQAKSPSGDMEPMEPVEEVAVPAEVNAPEPVVEETEAGKTPEPESGQVEAPKQEEPVREEGKKGRRRRRKRESAETEEGLGRMRRKPKLDFPGVAESEWED